MQMMILKIRDGGGRVLKSGKASLLILNPCNLASVLTAQAAFAKSSILLMFRLSFSVQDGIGGTWVTPHSGKHPLTLSVLAFLEHSFSHLWAHFFPFNILHSEDPVLVPFLSPCTLPGTYFIGVLSITNLELQAPISACWTSSTVL